MVNKEKILVVEDERIVAEEIKRRVQNLGYDVSAIVSTGKDAILKAGNLHPDLVLMDIKLQGKVDGIEAAKQIQEKFQIPVVYLTSHSDDKILEEAKKTQPYGFLIKPINERELHSTLQMSLYKHKIDQKLKESEEKFRTLYSSMNEGVSLQEIIYKEGRAIDYKIIDVNPAYELLTGIKKENAVGKRGSKLYGAEGLLYLDKYAKVANTRASITFEAYFPKSNKYFIISVFSPKKRQFATVFTDITEQKKAEIKIVESEKKYKTLLENINDAVFILDPKGNIIETNEVAETITGYSIEELLNMNVLEFNPKNSAQKRIDVIPNVIKNGFFRFEDVIEKKNGCIIQVEVNAKLIEYKGRKVIHTVVRDITEIKKMVKKIEEHALELENKVKERTKELELEKEKYKSLFEESNDPIFIINPESNKLIDCNYKAKITLGLNKEEWINKKFHDLFIKEDKNIILKSLKIACKSGNTTFISQAFSKQENNLIFLEISLKLIEYGKHKIIQAICRDITQTKKIEDGIMKKALKYELNRGYGYLIDESVLDLSFDIFNNVLECGFNGYIFSRTLPEILKRNVLENVSIYWLAQKKIGRYTIIPKIKNIESKIENLPRGNNIILLERLDYLLTNNSFNEILRFIQRIIEFIYLQKWILLISIDSRILNKKELNLLKKETLTVKPKGKLELDKKILSVLKHINNLNKLGKMPSINEIAGHFNISRDTARKRINLLDLKGLIKINKTGRLKLLEITNKGKENL